ncbi:hypothetical protein EG329_007607 [Mollisiaceae sp. DMI_Dod_QoI]|nr:hypothetical protein EG329_007607 [Helotiales sp. DMI_Dod_QoI]
MDNSYEQNDRKDRTKRPADGKMRDLLEAGHARKSSRDGREGNDTTGKGPQRSKTTLKEGRIEG